jgi:transcription antitermination factor NusG
MVKTIHVHVHGKTKDAPEQTIEYVNKFTGKKFTVKVHPDRAFEKLNQLKASWQVASARIIPSSGKDEAPCSCKSHAKDATLVHTDKGKIVRLYAGIIGKVLEVDENKKRAYVEVQSAREGSYKMWVDFSEVES